MEPYAWSDFLGISTLTNLRIILEKIGISSIKINNSQYLKPKNDYTIGFNMLKDVRNAACYKKKIFVQNVLLDNRF